MTHREEIIGDCRLILGDCREVLKDIADCSIDSCVTDPPYALVSVVKRFGGANAAPARDGDVYARASAGFMGKQWDTGETAFDPAFWAEVWRVLKPGAHLIAFSGTRTYHRLAVAIEDAGFEIRDQIGWLYGSGFPKSLDVSKAIDKAAGAEREVLGYTANARPNRVGKETKLSGAQTIGGEITAPAPDAAREWSGWGTALKPAWEPIVLARKPLVGTVAANVLAHGTGALNIDGCRVEGENTERQNRAEMGCHGGNVAREYATGSDKGRWPANVIHDGSEEVVALFPDRDGAVSNSRPNGKVGTPCYGDFGPTAKTMGRADSGSAARFFYSAKADAADRLGSKHPTVKPVDLMAYLCRLVTPPGGVVLDPFAGSGTTGMACLREGFNAILIEREVEYVADIRRRLAHVSGGDTPLFTEPAPKPVQGSLLGDAA